MALCLLAVPGIAQKRKCCGYDRVGQSALGLNYGMVHAPKGLSYYWVMAPGTGIEVLAGIDRPWQHSEFVREHNQPLLKSGATVIGLGYQPFVALEEGRNVFRFYLNVMPRLRLHHNREAFTMDDRHGSWAMPEISLGAGMMLELGNAVQLYGHAAWLYFNPSWGHGGERNGYTSSKESALGIRFRIS
jgi:hypothetical protein